MAHANKAQVARRVEEVLRIRLDGAEFWDVVAYVREKEAEAGSLWELAEGDSPLSESAIRRYLTRADAALIGSLENNRKKLFRQHLAKRRSLYGRAVTSGELRTALAVLQDEAHLLHLYDMVSSKKPLFDAEETRRALQAALAALDAGQADGAGVAVPAAPASPGAGLPAAADGPELQPPDCGDAGAAR